MLETVYCDFTKLPGDAGKPFKNYFSSIELTQTAISQSNTPIKV
jgi:hypothetical protein